MTTAIAGEWALFQNGDVRKLPENVNFLTEIVQPFKLFVFLTKFDFRGKKKDRA